MKALVFGALGFAAGMVFVNLSLIKIWKDENWQAFTEDIDNRLSHSLNRPRQLNVEVSASEVDKEIHDFFRAHGAP